MIKRTNVQFAVVVTPDYRGWALSVSLWISSIIFTSVSWSFPMANLWLHSFTTCSFLHLSLRLTVYPPPHEVLPSHDQPNALGSLISQSSSPSETCSQISSHLKQRSALWILVWSVRGSAGSAVHHGKWMLLPAACWFIIERLIWINVSLARSRPAKEPHSSCYASEIFCNSDKCNSCGMTTQFCGLKYYAA